MVWFQRAYRADGGTSNRYNLNFATDYIGYSWESNHHRALADTLAAKGIHFHQVIRGKLKGDKLKENEKFSAWFSTLRESGGGVHVGP